MIFVSVFTISYVICLSWHKISLVQVSHDKQLSLKRGRRFLDCGHCFYAYIQYSSGFCWSVYCFAGLQLSSNPLFYLTFIVPFQDLEIYKKSLISQPPSFISARNLFKPSIIVYRKNSIKDQQKPLYVT